MSSITDLHSFYITHKKFFDAFSISEQGAIGFLQTLVTDPESSFFSIQDLGVKPLLQTESTEMPVKLEKRRVAYVVDPYQKAVLNKAWGDVYDLDFTMSMKVGHPMAAAFKVLECEACLSLCDHTQPIIDSGGNWSYHVRQNRQMMHSCCPLLSVRDASRQSGRQLECKTTANDSKARASEYAKRVMKDPSLAYCNKKCEECTVQAKTMLWIHSIYGMRIDDLARQMASHGCSVGYGCFMFSDSVFDDMEGPLKDIDATFSRVGDRIRFFFNRDPSATYDHSWSDYVKFLVDRLITTADHTYYYRVFPTSRNSMIFTVTRLDTSRITSSLCKDYVVTRSRRPKVSLTVYDIDWTRSVSDRRFMVVREVLVPAEFYHEVLSFAFAKMRDESESESLDFNAFYRHCRTANRYLDINGNPISGVDKVPVREFNSVAVSLFHLAAMIVAYRRVHTGLVLKDLQKRRALADQGFFSNLFRYCKTFLPTMSSMRNLIDDFRTVLLTKVDNDCIAVIAEEESRYRKIRSMTFSGAVTTEVVDREVGFRRDHSEEWNATSDDMNLVVSLLDEQGDKRMAEFMRDKLVLGSVSSGTLVGDSTPKGAPALSDDGKSLVDPDEVEVDMEMTPADRMRCTNRAHDPADREAAALHRREAIDEYIEYSRKSFEKDLASARSQLKESWNKASGKPDKSYCLRKVQTVEGPNYLQFDGKQLVQSLIPLTVDGYMWGLCPETAELVRIVGGMKNDRGGNMRSNYRGWLFVCSELVVLNSHLIANAIEADIANRGGYGPEPVIYLSEGIAGSGKSTRIRLAHQPADMIFTSTSACKVDMIAALAPGGKHAPSDVVYSAQYLNSHVMTNHSFLIHSSRKADVIRCDESLLAHVGELYAVAMKAGAKVVYWSGDAVQIPFLNRIDSLMKLQRSTIEYFDHYEFWRKSYRLTRDAMKAANERCYRGLGRTCNPVEVGITFTKIADPSDPRIAEAMNRAQLSMGFYKSEKAELLKKAKSTVAKTVHEAQGEDHLDTVLVRFNDKDFGGLYMGPAQGGNGHAFVGCSRNSKSLQIFHRGGNDEICAFVEASKKPMPLDSYVFDEDIHEDRFAYF